jgi:hypothetical protein
MLTTVPCRAFEPHSGRTELGPHSRRKFCVAYHDPRPHTVSSQAVMGSPRSSMVMPYRRDVHAYMYVSASHHPAPHLLHVSLVRD